MQERSCQKGIQETLQQCFLIEALTVLWKRVYAWVMVAGKIELWSQDGWPDFIRWAFRLKSFSQSLRLRRFALGNGYNIAPEFGTVTLPTTLQFIPTKGSGRVASTRKRLVTLNSACWVLQVSWAGTYPVFVRIVLFLQMFVACLLVFI